VSEDLRIDRYQILDRIAIGGMGEVFRARAEGLDGADKIVAIKIVRREIANDPAFAAMFVEEARVALTLSHGNVVQAFDVGRADERYFIAMEYVDGIDLATLLRLCIERLRQPVPHRHALMIAIEALKGLDYAHRCRGPSGEPLGIIHRDMSPGNILLSLEGEVKIADFGVAKSALRTHRSLAGTLKGKLAYMAPEQLRGDPIDARADVYAMGAVLYEMLTGRRLFRGDGPALIPEILSATYPAPRAVVDGIPQELEARVLRALAPRRADRYPSAAAMLEDLEDQAWQLGYVLSAVDLACFVASVLSYARLVADEEPAALAAEPRDSEPPSQVTRPASPRATDRLAVL